MPTNLNIDDALLNQAKTIGGHRTKKATVEAALLEYIQRRQRQAILDLMGTVDFDPSWDYKAERKKR